MNILRLVVVGLFFSILKACGSDNGEKKGAIPEHQLKALDKANNIESTLLEQEQKRKKKMEEQGL